MTKAIDLTINTINTVNAVITTAAPMEPACIRHGLIPPNNCWQKKMQFPSCHMPIFRSFSAPTHARVAQR